MTSISTFRNGGMTGNSIAIGFFTGGALTGQGGNAIAIGVNAGLTGQGESSVAVGLSAGYSNQATNTVAIGNTAGYTGQGQNAVAIGVGCANNNQGDSSVAVGRFAGQVSQGANAVSIGNTAGLTGQGGNAIAIGNGAGQTNQHANSIVLNATGAILNSATSSAFYVAPIRSTTGSATSNLLFYDPTTDEIQCCSDISNNSTDLIVRKNITTSGTVSTNSITTNYSSLPTLTSTQIGYMPYIGITGKTFTSNIGQTVASLTLPAGVWIMTANLCVQSSNQAMGNIGVVSYCLNNSANMINGANSSFPSINSWYNGSNLNTSLGNTFLVYSNQVVHSISLTTSATIYFSVYFSFNGASTLSSIGGFMNAVRIA